MSFLELKIRISQFENLISSVTQSCPSLCNPMDCNMPGFPVHHQLPELVHTHVHRVSDAIQPSHSLSSPSLPTFSLSQHQGLFPVSQFFASGGQSIGVSASASVSPSNEYSGLISFRMDWFKLFAIQGTLSVVFSNTTVQKHQFFSSQLPL